jgi:hypothetical protein
MIEEIEVENIFELRKPLSAYRGSSSLTESAKIVPENRKIIPFCTINMSNVNNNLLFSEIVCDYLTEIGMKEELVEALTTDYYPDNMKQLLTRAINSLITLNTTHYGNSSAKAILSKFNKEQFTTILTYLVHKHKGQLDNKIANIEVHNKVFNGVPDINGYIHKYSQVLDLFYADKGGRYTIFKTRDPDLKYVIGKYYIAHYNRITGETIPLVCMVTKRKYIPYFKAAQTVGDYAHSEYVELWVKDGFDIVNSPHRSLRSKYRKEIKKPLEQAGINIVTKENLNELFLEYQLPKFNTINQYEQFLKDASVEALTELQTIK